MTQGEIFSLAKSLYTNIKIDEEVINKLNMAFNELYAVASVHTDPVKRSTFLQLVMDLKDELEKGAVSKSADIMLEFLSLLQDEKRVEPDIENDFKREDLIETFKENLRIMSKYNSSLFVGLMTCLFPDKCKAEEEVNKENVGKTIEKFSKYINNYKGELINQKLVNYTDLESINQMERESIYDNPNRNYSLDLDYCGNKSIKVVDNNETFYLPSGYDSKLEATAIFDSINHRIDSAYILIGLANGDCLKTFLDNSKEDNEIICVEPDVEVFVKAMHIFKLPKQEDKVRCYIFVNGINGTKLDAIIQHIITPQRVPVTSVIAISNCFRYYSKEVREYNEKFHKASKWGAMNLNTKILRGYNSVENAILNLPIFIKNSSIYEAVAALKEYKDRTAFIVGAGPSLDKNVDELKKVKNKGIIIASDTAVKILFKHGIVPDLVVTIDSVKKKETFDDDRLKDIPTIAGAGALNIAVKDHRSKVFFITDFDYFRYFILKYDKQDVFFSTGGSVATSAIFYATLVGFENIVLVGMDLAMTGKKFHASDVYKEGDIDLSDPQFIKCEAYDGGEVYSTPDYLAYAEWIEDCSKRLRETKIINSTEGGLKIRGIENAKLSDMVALEQDKKEIDFTKLLNEAPNVFSKEEIEEILDINYSYIDFSKKQDKKLKLLIADLEKAKMDFVAGKNVDFAPLFDRVHEVDEAANSNAYQNLVSIRSKEKEKKAYESVIGFEEKAEGNDPVKLLDAVINILKGTLEANKEVGDKLSEIYKAN